MSVVADSLIERSNVLESIDSAVRAARAVARICRYVVVARYLILPAAAVTGLFAEDFVGKVVGITDGDTVRVLRNGVAESVRLFGIDCPEAKQAFGTRGKQFTSDLAFEKGVTVRVRRR